MISLRTHISINKSADSTGNLDKAIGDLSNLQKIAIMREISDVYPMKDDILADESYLRDFKVYDNVMDLHLGQFIMLEQIITSKEKYKHDVDNDFDIAKLIIRPKHHKEFDNENPEQEKQNKENILDSDVKNVYGCIYKYMSDREHVLFKQFSGVFYNVRDYDEEEESEKEELIGEDLFHSQWYWYNIVRLLAQEDIRRYGEIYMLKMSTVLPEMSFLAQKNKIEKMRAKQSQMMHKL